MYCDKVSVTYETEAAKLLFQYKFFLLNWVKQFFRVSFVNFARVFFLIKLQAVGVQLYLKKDSGTSVFLQILRNF